MSSAAPLAEPQVLAHAKRRLFPADDESDSYVVADTQFAQSEWLAEQPIPDRIREQLAPFNHVRVGSGYPDLVGVRCLDAELLAVDRLGDDPPLVAIEAKGHTGAGGGVNVERGVVQAYDRLHEANAAYVAAPAGTISQSDRTLARELNVGVLAIHEDGEVSPREVPRVVGNRSADEASAIRFQATAQGVADKSFGLNHPKNYLAYPLAVQHADATEDVLAERVVEAVDGARTGAEFLGLVQEAPDRSGRSTLTPLGEEVVRFALDEYGSVDAALDEFANWQRSQQRFCELAPKWGLLTRRVLWAYRATPLLVTELQAMHDDGIPDPSLVDLVEWLHVQHPTFTVELFLKGSEDVRARALTDDGDLRREPLMEGESYHSPTVFQLKAMLYHAGVLADRGAEPHRLDPPTDSWRLRHPIDGHR
jgi:hypothetical protein